jgi:hypothetical protein
MLSILAVVVAASASWVSPLPLERHAARPAAGRSPAAATVGTLVTVNASAAADHHVRALLDAAAAEPHDPPWPSVDLFAATLKGDDASARRSAQPSVGSRRRSADARGDAYAFGSGTYGRWGRDRFGSPRYDLCGVPAGPQPEHAVPPRPYPSVFHRVGNDRVCGVALSDGSVLLKHDEHLTTLEGDGTFLGRDAPYASDGYAVAGGGWGFLVDAADGAAPVVLGQTREQAAVTPGGNLSLGFGVSYVEKNISAGGVAVSQAVFAPFGGDPVLLSSTTVTNHRRRAATLRWTEVWPATTVLMNEHGRLNYVRTVKAFPSEHGDRIEATAVANVTAPPGPALPYPANITANASWYDLSPLPVFFGVLRSGEGGGAVWSGVTTRASDLFGPPHSAASPRPTPLGGGWLAAFDNSFPARSPSAGVYAIERTLVLRSGESAELRSLFGYAADGFDAAALSRKYAGERGSLRWTVEQWARMPQPRLAIPGDEGVWIERELRWHSYMLRGGLSRYDSWWNESMLSQAGSYEWDNIHGGEGNARDPLSHVMPFAYNGGAATEALRSVVQLILKSKRVTGPYAHYLPAGIDAVLISPLGPAFNPSDEEMYLLLTASEYVLGQRDAAWLGRCITSPYGWTATVGESLWQSFLHLRDSIGVGTHGLIRLQTADHNDGILGQFKLQNASWANHSTATNMGESVMNAGLAAYSLHQYAEALTLQGGAASLQRAAEVRAFAGGQRAAADRAWSACPSPSPVAGWYKRAYLGSDQLGWRGQCGGPAMVGQPAGGIMWTETQSWCLLGDVDRLANRTAGLLHAIEALARRPSPIGALNAPPTPMEDRGTSYGGVWSCGNQALVQASMAPCLPWSHHAPSGAMTGCRTGKHGAPGAGPRQAWRCVGLRRVAEGPARDARLGLRPDEGHAGILHRHRLSRIAIRALM